jgi:hypothetical protein
MLSANQLNFSTRQGGDLPAFQTALNAFRFGP